MVLLCAVAHSLYRVAMFIGSLWCHQRPERSPHLWGMQMPLCWRCTGILAGASLLVIWLFTRKRLPPLIASSSLALLLPLDVLINSLGYADSANARRLVTGVLWGVFGVSVNLHLARWCYGLWARPGTGFQSQDSAPGPVKDGAV